MNEKKPEYAPKSVNHSVLSLLKSAPLFSFTMLYVQPVECGYSGYRPVIDLKDKN